MTDAFFELPKLPHPPLPPDLVEKGWKYQDFPTRFSPRAWGHLLALIGEGEYQLLITSQGTYKNGEPWIRGQFFISPQGYLNMHDEERRVRLAPKGF